MDDDQVYVGTYSYHSSLLNIMINGIMEWNNTALEYSA